MKSIVFLGVDAEDEARVKSAFPQAKIYSESPEGKALVEACKDAEIVSAFIYSPFPSDVLEQLPKLKLLCTRSVGFNHIDLDTAKAQGITVCNVPDYGSHVIAEHVFALLLGTLRHVYEADKQVEGGDFDYHGLRGMALHGKTLGIVGTGKIGASAAKIAHGFGMRIVAFDVQQNGVLEDAYGVEYVPLQELFSQSDIITLHAPANEHTYHMLNKAAFDRMKKGVIIVNTARGELIDTPALVSALESEKVSYALLDVLEHEKNFEDNESLIDHPHAITTPHIAFYADDSMGNMYEDCFTSMQVFLEGKKPQHAV